MYEFTILIKATNEQDFIYGYTWSDAIQRAKLEDALQKGEIVYLMREYID